MEGSSLLIKRLERVETVYLWVNFLNPYGFSFLNQVTEIGIYK